MRNGSGSFRQWTLILGVLLALILIFPRAMAFVELAARELRYLWWLVLLVALGVWLVLASKRRS